jgi:hypothetical protein
MKDSTGDVLCAAVAAGGDLHPAIEDICAQLCGVVAGDFGVRIETASEDETAHRFCSRTSCWTSHGAASNLPLSLVWGPGGTTCPAIPCRCPTRCSICWASIRLGQGDAGDDPCAGAS